MPMRLIVLAALGAVVSAPSMAQTTRVSSDKPVTTKGDPNRMICRTEQSTGSRLAPSTKRCLTALQWAEIKQSDRNDIEQIQRNRAKNN